MITRLSFTHGLNLHNLTPSTDLEDGEISVSLNNMSGHGTISTRVMSDHGTYHMGRHSHDQ